MCRIECIIFFLNYFILCFTHNSTFLPKCHARFGSKRMAESDAMCDSICFSPNKYRSFKCAIALSMKCSVFRFNRRQNRRRDLGTRLMLRALSSNSKTRETPRSSLLLARTYFNTTCITSLLLLLTRMR